MNSLCFVFAISVVVYVTKACIPTPPTPAPTTAASTSTKTTPTTSGTNTPKYDCPIGGLQSKGVTCITSNNVVKIVPDIKNVLDCSKY